MKHLTHLLHIVSLFSLSIQLVTQLYDATIVIPIQVNILWRFYFEFWALFKLNFKKRAPWRFICELTTSYNAKMLFIKNQFVLMFSLAFN